ncbi:hypothetical protein PINS_up004490 [Pythium insidiosum]|nr:hypothetical protein PINS_up004490 [Pythium insidiosum]
MPLLRLRLHLHLHLHRGRRRCRGRALWMKEAFRESEEDAKQWTLERVADWLRDHELDMFIVEFQQHQIDGAYLVSAQMEMFLESQSSAARGHKKKLQREIQKLRTDRVERSSSVSESSTPVPSPPRMPMVPPPERNSLRRMGVNLRVNTDTQPTAAATERHFSPVTALRARATHGQANDYRGRVQRARGSISSLDSASDDDRSSTPRVANQSGDYVSKAPPSLQIDIASSANHHQKLLSPDPLPDPGNQHVGRRDLRSIRQALGGLDLDMVKVKKQERTVEASFDFTAEGRLQTQGFEINTNGIANVPFPHRHAVKSTPLGTREYLLVLNELGHGAGGKVYKALYLPTFKLVAVKVIRVYDQKKRHQMVRELKSLYANYMPITEPTSNAACDELVVFYDAFTNPEAGTVSIVLEYMDGGSLEDSMQSSPGRYQSEKELANVARCVLKGLAFLHEHHQLHRDIKLSNMLINQRGQVKISDFGISRDLESTLAKATTFTGTLLYMAPERISGGTYSYPSDIWSFGLALMTCAIGKLPVPTKEGYWGVVHAVQEQPSPKLRDYGDHFSPELCDFIDQCLQKNPIARPSAAQLLEHSFIKNNCNTTSSVANPDTSPITSPSAQDHDGRNARELDKIAHQVRAWCADHAETLLSPTHVSSAVFHQFSFREKVQTLAAQLRLPVEAVAAKLSFMEAY